MSVEGSFTVDKLLNLFLVFFTVAREYIAFMLYDVFEREFVCTVSKNVLLE